MNKIKIAGFLLAAGMVVPAGLADTVVLTQGPYSYADGGEFTATTSPTISVSRYSPYTSTATSFQTFCVETGVEFQPGDTYTYTLSGISIGAPGYPGGPASPGTPDSYRLTQGTAWLYSQFASGNLGGYDFANTLGARKTDAGILQSAIWFFQGNQSIGGFPSGAPALVGGNIYADEAIAAIGAAAYANVTATTSYGVAIMNLTQFTGGDGDNGPGNYQNQLVLVPDGGSTVILLGAALSGLAMYRRKF